MQGKRRNAHFAARHNFFVTSLNQDIQLEREYLNENEVSYPLGNIKGCLIQNQGIVKKEDAYQN